MGKIKEWYRSIPIWVALFTVIAFALLAASALSGIVTKTVDEQYVSLQAKYITTTSIVQEDEETSSNGEVLKVTFNYEDYSEDDQRICQTYSIILNWGPMLIYSTCILTFVLLFYFTKLRKPLRMLTEASNQIAINELDFHLDYPGKDEMAGVCAAFEKMRSALDENNRQMLCMLDERKQLNDAYTHDLRTPIAVLKGYTDLLVKYFPSGKMLPEEVVETAKTMSSQVERLEQFVDSMNNAQKLEDIEVRREQVDAQEFLEYLKESADILCQESGLEYEFHSCGYEKYLYLDPAVVFQTYENIMSNAVRFAHLRIRIICGVEKNYFFISVKDDGRGFSPRELREATRPYYSNDEKKTEYHFGLGLHICRVLSEKHGGGVELKNDQSDGACVTATFLQK